MPATLVRAALTAVLLAALALLPLPASAATATIEARFEISSASVLITGTLQADGDPLRQERVVATLDGSVRAEATTGGKGRFSLAFQLPGDLPEGRHEVAVEFPGSQAAGSAKAATTFTVGAGGTPEPSSGPGDGGGGEPTTAPDTRATLTADGPGEAVNGSLVTLYGTLTVPSGGLGNAGITVSDGGGEVDESFTVTGSNGSFTTYYSVPEDAADGSLTLTLSFAGASGIAAASDTVTIAIRHTEVPTAQPSESPTGSPSASATASVATTPAPSETPIVTEATPDNGSPMGGFVIATVVVGGLGVMAASVLVFRSFRGRVRRDDEERSLDVFDDGPFF